jgi:ABC-2 type transport system permease protein
MSVLRLAAVSGWLGFRALFAWNTPGLFFISLLAVPLLQITFFALLGAAAGYQDPTFFLIGNAVLASAMAGMVGMITVIADERRFGTLAHIVASPAVRAAVFAGRAAPSALLGTAVSLLCLLLGAVVLSAPIGWADVPALIGLLLAAGFACSCLGLALSAFGLAYREVFSVANAVYLTLLICTGANVAFGDLPGWLKAVGRGLPLTHALAGVRELAAGAPVGAAPFAFEFLVGFAWLAAALAMLRVFEHMAVRRGTTDLY